MEYNSSYPETNKKQMRRKRRRTGLITNMLLCIIALSALTGCIILLIQNNQLQKQSVEVMSRMEEYEEKPSGIVFSEEEAQAIAESLADEAAKEAALETEMNLLNNLKEQMINGEGTVQMLRYFFPDEVIVYADATYHFIPIVDSLKKHTYLHDNFVLEEEHKLTYYDENGEAVSLRGIDVSKYQGSINWEKVAGDEISFALIRAGVRGANEGNLVLDETFEKNMEEAIGNGLDVGVYFFTQALTEQEAVEEAEFVLDAIGPYNVTYPIVIDVEDVGTKNPRTSDMTREDWTKITIAFCDRIKEAGYTPMIYGNLKSFMLMLDLEQLEEYEKWFANFSIPFYFPYDFSIWQYTSTGRVDGIKGDVDINISMRPYSE